MQINAKKYDVDMDFTLNGYCAGYAHKKNSSFVDSLSSLFSRLELKPVFYTRSGISDANVLNAKGIETFNLTDGTKYPHTTSEQIAVKDLIKLSEIVKKCITEL